MPFASEKQRRWMHKNKPEMAKKWEKEKVRSFKSFSHPLAGITPKPTKEEADELMSNLPITNKKLKSMGKTRKKFKTGLLEQRGM